METKEWDVREAFKTLSLAAKGNNEMVVKFPLPVYVYGLILDLARFHAYFGPTRDYDTLKALDIMISQGADTIRKEVRRLEAFNQSHEEN